ncbi:Polyadenylate-binding protein 5 [Cardamine amara subsp. amara]|uniref:Polyadenylate-binding protein 5 n=1 Tax=Cardamine amara subsp. amara TaxID=228776 RepID=A0ABD0ZPS2_CARAN
MTSSLISLMMVMAAIVLATTFSGFPPYLLRHRYGTELKISNDDHHRSSSGPSQFTNLYIADLDAQVSEEMLVQMFSGFGKIRRSVLAKDFRGESREFAFIEFESADSAGRAVIQMNGRLIGQKILYVERTPKVEEGQDY